MIEAGRGRLRGRLALVSGASRGLGAAVAKRFAAEGAHLILVARTQGALEELDDEIRAAGHEPPTLLGLDLHQHDKIDQIGEAIRERFGRLDVLVANAAILGVLSPMGHIDPRTWDATMSLNATANWRLVRALDPLLRTSPAGRAIFVTCAAARELRAYWGPYGASKAALEALARIYAAEMSNTSVRVNLIDPGPLATRLRLQAFPAEDRSKLRLPEQATEEFVALASAAETRNGALVSTYHG